MIIQRSDAIEAIHRGLANNPGVALLGPRQCGKTTLARQVAQERCAKIANDAFMQNLRAAIAAVNKSATDA